MMIVSQDHFALFVTLPGRDPARVWPVIINRGLAILYNGPHMPISPEQCCAVGDSATIETEDAP
jgi:hypothetical protein